MNATNSSINCLDFGDIGSKDYDFCQKVKYYQEHNITSIKDYFDSICCTDQVVMEYCKYIITYVLKEEFEISCKSYESYSFILLSICLPLGLIGNLLILYSVLRQNILPKQTSYFLSSLSIGDIGVILEFIIFLIYEHSSKNISERANMFLMPSLHMFFASVSLIQISVISVERAVAVTWPLYYPRYITRRRAKYITIFIWAWSLINFITSLIRIPVKSKAFNDYVFYTNITVLLIFPILTVLSSYALVAATAFQNINTEKRRARMVTNLLKASHIQVKRNSNWSVHSIRQKEVRISVNLAVMVLPFLCCWGFFMFVHIYETLSKHRLSGIVDWLILALPLIVSCTNPLAYMILTRSLRKAVSRLLRDTIFKSIMAGPRRHNNNNTINSSVSLTPNTYLIKSQNPMIGERQVFNEIDEDPKVYKYAKEILTKQFQNVDGTSETKFK